MPMNNIKDILEKNGCAVSVDGDFLDVNLDGERNRIKVTQDWIDAISSYKKSRQFSFDEGRKVLSGYKTVEAGVSRISQSFFLRPNYEFKSNNSKKVVFRSESTTDFILAFFFSNEYSEYFNAIVKRRLTRKVRRINVIEDILWKPPTIKYSVARKIDREKLLADATLCFENCLFKLAVDKGQCWELMKSRSKSKQIIYDETDDDEMTIPLAHYDLNLVKYYKVGVSSQFASQSFLSFYHVLEYNFLSVSDEELHSKIKSNIQSTSFNGKSSDIQNIINIVKRHTDRSDEKEMLIRVLRKYIDEDELIDFVSTLENKLGDKKYTKTRSVFGESFNISLKKDHVISNVALVLKHIRNALVHSSDKYNREECHIPLTDSEYIIVDYIPIVKFLAEKLIYAK
ncbi:MULTISPECIES: hypothetical protein [Pectobacterium]|uniref:hypothetical protein n=1 Tax=Pectobacterium TaxID=122277 RepID=UPI00102E6287|nr:MULTISPECIES: hypothetical protein [Pectobacterium]TAI96688.1 hypothetical protein EG332_12950 [Pectobacterium versatile]UEQ08253.1 hypothetical protein LLE50_15545 [Pectobacterium versatile]